MFGLSIERIITKLGEVSHKDFSDGSNGQWAKGYETLSSRSKNGFSGNVATHFTPSAASQNNPWEKGTGTRK